MSGFLLLLFGLPVFVLVIRFWGRLLRNLIGKAIRLYGPVISERHDATPLPFEHSPARR